MATTTKERKMTYVKKADQRVYRAGVDDGRGVGRARIEDGYGRVVAYARHDVVGVHTERETIDATFAEGIEFRAVCHKCGGWDHTAEDEGKCY